MSFRDQQVSFWGVDAWRGVAALMVVYSHFWAYSGQDWPPLRMMFTGVDLFFVLSGFVFAPYFAGKTMSVPAFAVRRLFRIYPAFVLALAVYVALKWRAGHEILYLSEHLTFTFLQSRAMAFYYNPPFWSLPAEVEFYLLLPAMIWLLSKRSDNLTKRAGATWVWRFMPLFVMALGLRLWVGFMSERDSENLFFILNYHLPGLLLEFLLGVLTWRCCHSSKAWAWRWFLMGLGLAGWMGLAVLFGQVGDSGIDASWLRGQLSWLAALCFALMVCGSLAEFPGSARLPEVSPTPAFWLIGSRWLAAWAGRLSYGVYLFHLAALQLVTPWRETFQDWPLGYQSIAVVLTLGMAWLSLQFCEDPMRRWGRRLALRWEPRPTTLAP